MYKKNKNLNNATESDQRKEASESQEKKVR